VQLEPLAFSSLKGFETDHVGETFALFQRMAAHVLSNKDSLRAACAPSPALRIVYQNALAAGILDDAAARAFLRRIFSRSGFMPILLVSSPDIMSRMSRGRLSPLPNLQRPFWRGLMIWSH